MSTRGSQLLLFIISLPLLACAAARQVARPVHPERPRRTVQAAPRPRPIDGLYAPEEALKDALSGRWEYLGTGSWPGISRLHACVFRNDRVLIVNVYCTATETQAFRVDVYSPKRGRVRIYAEAKGPVSGRTRQDYFTFMAESEPPPGPEAPMPQLILSMSFSELRAYEERRYDAYLPACYGGQELFQKRRGCLGALAPRESAWTDRNRAFLERASDDWYRMVRAMRAVSVRFGRDPK